MSTISGISGAGAKAEGAAAAAGAGEAPGAAASGLMGKAMSMLKPPAGGSSPGAAG